eukprot:11217860-Lingulodinium_polyedra.AAC.1
MHPRAWQESCDRCKPAGILCGQLVLHQLLNQRVYLVEQPDPGGLFTEHFWPRTQAHPHNIAQLVHQCMIGQRVADG